MVGTASCERGRRERFKRTGKRRYLCSILDWALDCMEIYPQQGSFPMGASLFCQQSDGTSVRRRPPDRICQKFEAHNSIRRATGFRPRCPCVSRAHLLNGSVAHSTNFTTILPDFDRKWGDIILKRPTQEVWIVEGKGRFSKTRYCQKICNGGMDIMSGFFHFLLS